MNSRRWTETGHIALLIFLGTCLQAGLVFSQALQRAHCAVDKSELPTGLLPSQPQALHNKAYLQALAEFKQGELKQAAEELRALDFASARNALGVVLQKLGDRHGALDSFQQARKLWPDSAQVAYNLAYLMMQLGRPNAAILQLERTTNRYSDHGVMRFALNLLLAEAYHITGKDKLAAQTLEGLLPENPTSAELYFRLATIYSSLGSLEASVAQYREDLRLKPDDCPALMGLGRILLQMGKASEAMPSLKEYVRLQPNDAEGYYVSGRAFRDLGQLTDAVAMFSKAVYFHPEDYDMRYELAKALWKTGHPESARRQFEAAERIKPDEVQVHSALAQILSEIGEVEQARKEGSSAEQLISSRRNLDRASLCIGMGNALLQRGDFKNAEGRFREALQLDPQNARALSNLGLVLTLLHHPQDAERELQRAIALEPKLALAYNALGLSYAEEGRISEAKTAFEHAIQIDPEYAEAKNNLGALYAKSGKNADAVTLFEQATEDSPQYPQSYLNWGLVLANEGNVSLAKAMFEKALQLSPDLEQARKALQLVEGETKAQD